MKLYENIIIGNFLYALGASIGKATAHTTQLSVISLMQQTPDDKLLGDLLVEFPGVVKLIEFKNKKSSKKKEEGKMRQLKIALNNDANMLRISNSVHWYIETDPLNKICFNKITPYLRAFEPSTNNYTLESYLREITQEVLADNGTTDRGAVRTYLQVVAGCQGTTGGGSGSGGSINANSGGLLLCVGTAELNFVQFTDTLQLQLQHREFIHFISNEMVSIMRPEIERNKNREHEHDLTDKFGLSL